jgi:hypothetical protein
MAGLTALLKEIEAHGLPETSLSIHSEHARKFDRMLEHFAAAKRQYDRLSSRGQQRWREHYALKNQREDRILPTFLKSYFGFTSGRARPMWKTIALRLEPIRKVWIHEEAFAASRLSMMRIMARRRNAATVAA